MEYLGMWRTLGSGECGEGAKRFPGEVNLMTRTCRRALKTNHSLALNDEPRAIFLERRGSYPREQTVDPATVVQTFVSRCAECGIEEDSR
jgi:hypothetical protein